MPDTPKTFDWQDIAQTFDVPPWVISGSYRAPRFRRIRWSLRRWWPIPKRDVPGV